MTDDERLDNLIRKTLAASSLPPDAPMDAMWADIERRSFDRPQVRQIPRAREWRWHTTALAAAAALVIGTGLGWSLAPRRTITRVIAAPAQVIAMEPRRDTTQQRPATSSEPAPRLAIGSEAPASEQRGNAAVTIARHGTDVAMSRLAAQFNDVGSGSDMGRYLAQTSALLASIPSDRVPAESDTTIATRASDLLTQTHLLLDSRAGSDPTLHRLLEDLELVLAQVARLRVERNSTDLQMIHQAITVHDVLPRVHDASLEASITN